MKNPLLILGVLGLLQFACGCQQQVSLSTWKQSVEHYVWDQANGDPSALRDLPSPGPWKGFAVISENAPESATDINGVLLGHRQIGAKPYFVFLVGIVQKQQVQDIRLAAVWPSAENFEWHIAEKNKQSFDAYRQFQDAAWRKLFADRVTGPWSYTGFPCEADQFKLSVAGNTLTATHEGSGASWSLELAPSGTTTAPAVAGSN